MRVPVWNDRRWPAEQGVAAPQAPPQAQAWWSGHWGEGQSWWWEDVIVQGKDKGAHADKGKGKGWGVPLGSGTSHKGCDKGHQGKHADKGKPVEGKGWGVLPGHADKGKPVEGKGWGVHPGRWPSDPGRQGKHADKGKLVEGEGKGGEPEHKPKAKGWAQWKPKSGRPKDLG